MSRVVWTREEKLALLACMTDMCYVTPTMTSKGLLRHAQEEVIPPDRRLKITDQRVFNYKALIAQARADAEKHRNKATTPLPETKPAPAPAAEQPVRKVDSIGDVFELLVDAIADRIIKRLEERETVVTPEHAEVTPTATLPGGWLEELEKLSIRSKEAKVAKARRPTALVVGLLGVQMECIKQSNPGVDFTFVTAEQALSHYTFNKDHTFLMTKFINHSVQNKYRKHPNLHYVNGGVSELKTLLHGIFYKQEAA